MDKLQFNKINNVLERELDKFEYEMVNEKSQYLFDNTREIYAKKFVGDCLTDYEFMKDVDYSLFPKKLILEAITSCYLETHDEMRESDLHDMFTIFQQDLKSYLADYYADEM